MNEQKPPNAIEWTRILKPDGTYTKGFTWNVVGGCFHECKWTMPTGEEAECYAKTVAERVAQAAYPNGFAHHYWHPERLDEPLRVKEPAGIFIDSMADLMGHWVPDEQVQQVLDICRQAHWHRFFLLTKNAPRLSKFEFPPNVWVGASSPPDSFMGKPLSRDRQSAMLHRTLKTLQGIDAKVRWISFEPLSWDCSEIVAQYPGAINWAVIGAASNGRIEYPPAEADLLSMLTVLGNQDVPIFYKGNMRTLECAKLNWRHEFPKAEPTAQKPTRVVSFQDVKDEWDKATHSWHSDAFIYIGRSNPTYGLATSAFANPFKLERDTPEARAAAISQYRQYITKLMDEIPDLKPQLEALRGKTLVCWCRSINNPKPCHGDILIELLGERPPAAKQPEPEPKQLTLFDMPQPVNRHRYD